MLDDDLAEQPPVLPARMVNEFVYCPRFFHLAWSGKESGENDFTAEGKWIHRRIDRFDEGLPGADLGAPTVRRSVTLESESLGLMAKIDVVEAADGTAVPLEFKRGAPHDPDHPVWEPERVQLAVAALLLRDAGFSCDHGEVYFAGSRQRVRVEVDDELVERAVAVVDQMRRVAAEPLPPPPLVDSPKCPACIMVGICLPDENNLVRERTSCPTRRLLPTDDAARPLYVTVPGARVGKRGERIEVAVHREVIESVRMLDVSQLVVVGNVNVSSPLIRELLSREIPVAWYSFGGWFAGMAEGLPSKNVEVRRRQAMLSVHVEVSLASRMVEAKILNARTLLRRNGRPRSETLLREMKRYALRARKVSDVGELLGVEGAGAKVYFSMFSTMLKGTHGASFDFERRNRRPPRDRVNCLLSYVYGLLVRDLTAVCHTVGLDPYLGVFHRPRFGRPALALDLMEEFRPLIADSVVVGLINNGEVNARSFVEAGGAVSLSSDGRRTVLKAYERRMDTEFTHPTFKYRLTYRRALEVQARMVAAVIVGEFENYLPVVTR